MFVPFIGYLSGFFGLVIGVICQIPGFVKWWIKVIRVPKANEPETIRNRLIFYRICGHFLILLGWTLIVVLFVYSMAVSQFVLFIQ